MSNGYSPKQGREEEFYRRDKQNTEYGNIHTHCVQNTERSGAEVRMHGREGREVGGGVSDRRSRKVTRGKL